MEISDGAMDALFEGAESNETVETDVETTADVDGELADEQIPDTPEETTVDETETEDVVDETTGAQGEKKPAAEAADLPEGVRVSEKNGQQFWTMPADQARGVFAARQMTLKAAEIFGEDLTEEALQARQDAFLDFEDFRQDFVSGDAQSQRSVFNNLVRWADTAVRAGEADGDPAGSALDAFLGVMARARPEKIEAIANRFLSSFLDDLYAEAKQANNPKLEKLAQWFEKRATGKFRGLEASGDPNLSAIERREADLANRTRAEAQGRIEAWRTDVVKTNGEATTAAIEEALAPYAERYKEFPERWADIKELLQVRVARALVANKAWQRLNQNLYAKARMAKSDAIRADVKEQLSKRYKAQASAIAKQLAPALVTRSSQALKADATARSNRLKDGANRAATGTGVPERKSVPDMKAKPVRTVKDWQDSFEQIFQ